MSNTTSSSLLIELINRIWSDKAFGRTQLKGIISEHLEDGITRLNFEETTKLISDIRKENAAILDLNMVFIRTEEIQVCKYLLDNYLDELDIELIFDYLPEESDINEEDNLTIMKIKLLRRKD